MLSRLSFICFTLYLFGSVSGYAGFLEEKAAIDTYEETPAFFSQQIQTIHTFFLDSKVAKEDANLKRATILKAERTPGDTFEEHAVIGALDYIDELMLEDQPNATTLLSVAQTVSMLLSPEVLKKEYKPLNISLLKSVKKQAAFLMLVGVGNMETKDDPTTQNFTFQSSYFKPLIRLGKDAEFSMKGFLYGLSKGVFLMGLPEETSTVHGGIYASPAAVFAHDLAHISEFISQKKEPEAQRNFIKGIQTVAGQLNSFIEQKIDQEDQEKATLAAFYLFHEQNLLGHQDSFLEAFGIFKPLALERLEKLKKFFALALPGKINIVNDSGDFIHTRNASDYAKTICTVYPEAEKAIFLTSGDHSLTYNKKQTLDWNERLMTWFWDKVVELKFGDDL